MEDHDDRQTQRRSTQNIIVRRPNLGIRDGALVMDENAERKIDCACRLFLRNQAQEENASRNGQLVREKLKPRPVLRRPKTVNFPADPQSSNNTELRQKKNVVPRHAGSETGQLVKAPSQRETPN